MADEILLRDVPGLFDALFRTAVSPEEMAWPRPPATVTEGDAPSSGSSPRPAWASRCSSAAEMAVYVDTFTATGFTGGAQLVPQLRPQLGD